MNTIDLTPDAARTPVGAARIEAASAALQCASDVRCAAGVALADLVLETLPPADGRYRQLDADDLDSLDEACADYRAACAAHTAASEAFLAAVAGRSVRP